MSYEQTFEEQLLIEHNSRFQRESWERHCKQVRGEYIYTDFCVWCNAFNDSKGKNDAKLFGKFLKQENIELTNYQRLYLLEHYFGYDVWYSDNDNKYYAVKKEIKKKYE